VPTIPGGSAVSGLFVFTPHAMARKPRFPIEPETRPDARKPKAPATHKSGPAPKDVREKSEAPTLPPPNHPSERPSVRPARADRNSGFRSTRHDMGGATVDEVTADLSKDPRRERDEDESPSDAAPETQKNDKR
jgi:hypothetical protein